MKLLFDDNLSWRLEKYLKDAFPDSKHIRSIETLPIPARDIDIWTYALKYNYIIVTNDDFRPGSCLHETEGKNV